MAKYEDYVKDELSAEIADASAGSEARAEDAGIPDRFKGKTVEDVVKSYVELEKMNSRQAQDLGAMRRSVDTLLELESRRTNAKAEEPSKPSVTADELYEKPEEVIRRVAREEAEARVQNLEQEVMMGKATSALEQFGAKYPDWQTDVKDPSMIEWIKSKPYRVKLALAADRGDLDAADDLFGSYYDTKEAKKEEKKIERKAKVRAAGLESAGSTAPETVETYSRSALIEKRIAAKRGDAVAQRWLNSHANSIGTAYSEGRVVD